MRITFPQLSRGVATPPPSIYGQLMNLEVDALETRGFEICNHGRTVHGATIDLRPTFKRKRGNQVGSVPDISQEVHFRHAGRSGSPAATARPSSAARRRLEAALKLIKAPDQPCSLLAISATLRPW
jgi:hypothetical protein